MSHKLISLNSDLKQLRDEGYDIEIRSAYLLIKDVPYVNSNKEIKRGILVSELTLTGDKATKPSAHVAHFIGEYPCHKDGSDINQIRHPSGPQQLKDIGVNHSFSARPKPDGTYKDYYHKMTTYVAIISSPAYAIDSTVTAKTNPVIETTEEESVFKYLDTSSSRAGITAVTEKLKIGKIGIVGVGGTGSYVLDLVAKTPVGEIHLFDEDGFLTHNAFRSPGAPSLDELREKPKKVNYFKEQYSKMRRHIFAHDGYIDASNIELLQGMDFVFLCLDGGKDKRLIVERLEQWDIPFIDVGMGLYLTDGSLGGILRVTSSTIQKHDHVKERISFSEDDANNEYSQNIQIADMNALNAALAVIKWKKIFGFYHDFDNEHHSTYTIDGNKIDNENKL